MKKLCKKISVVLKRIFGWGIMIALFAGGVTFFGYLAALIIGGETGAEISTLIYKTIIPCIIKLSNVMILLGLVAMYFNGETALTPNKKKADKHQAET